MKGVNISCFWEEHVLRRLGVFEKEVWKRIFRVKLQSAMRRWRKIHNKELYSLYFSSGITRTEDSRNKHLPKSFISVHNTKRR